MINKFETEAGYIELNTRYAQVISNIENDGILIESQKQDFFDYLSTFDGATDFDEFCCSGFFHKKQQLGVKVNADNEELGHVICQSFLFRYLKLTNPGMDIIDIQNVFLDNDVDDIKFLFGDQKIRQYLMWSFRYFVRDLNNIDYRPIQDLPCYLGLRNPTPSPGIVNFFLITHIFATSDTKKPTAFDASLDTQWRPTGYSFPLEPCLTSPSDKCYDEYVHDPNFFKNIVLNIEAIAYDYK